jgi:predicted nucleic acid-binding protein
MAVKEALFDTSVLIEHFRCKDKKSSTLFQFTHSGVLPRVSALTRFEVMVGATAPQRRFWNELLDPFLVHAFDERVADEAVRIEQSIRKRGSGSIGMADLFIASTAIVHDLPLITLNQKHFQRVEGLRLL